MSPKEQEMASRMGIIYVLQHFFVLYSRLGVNFLVRSVECSLAHTTAKSTTVFLLFFSSEINNGR